MTEPAARDGLPTGVPGLDRVLGGGLAAPSLTLVAGPPGSGKTTLLHQVMFAGAGPERPALYVTLLGEPPLKMLRYQAQFEFFDPERVGRSVHYLSLGEEVMEGSLDRVLERITRAMAARDAELVFVDSVHSVLDRRDTSDGTPTSGSEFLHRLSVRLTGWEATSFVVGEYANPRPERDPIFTIADGVLWLETNRRTGGAGRSLEVLKLRGRDHFPGRHSFRITGGGLRVFPRLPEPGRDARRPQGRLGTGLPELDRMTGGGIPAGDAVLVAGPSGSGKSLLGLHFVQEGLRRGEAVVVVGFEEPPPVYRSRAARLGSPLDDAEEEGRLELLYPRPLDLSASELFAELDGAVRRTGARRVVVDSLTGCEVALGAGLRRDLRGALFRLVRGLTRAGATVLLTTEVPDEPDSFRFSPQRASFLSDDILLQRYVEIDGRLDRVLAVVKMRHSSHSHDLHRYRITSAGIEIGRPLRSIQGILTGRPAPAAESASPRPGLSRGECIVLDLLTTDGECSARDVARSTGLSQSEADRTLRRLRGLGYVLERRDAARPEPLFRAARPPLDPGPGEAP